MEIKTHLFLVAISNAHGRLFVLNPITPMRIHSRLPVPRARAAPAVIVATALAASGGLFYFSTSKRMAEKETPSAVSTPKEASSPVAATPPPLSKSEPKPEPAKPAAPPKPEKPNFGFARPLDLGKDLAQSLVRKDFTRASQLAAAGGDESRAGEARAVFEQIQALGYKPGPLQEVEVIGQMERFTRLSIPLQGPDGSDPLRLQLDVERDENMGWKIARFRLPPELAQTLAAAAPVGNTPETTPAPTPSPSPAPSPASKDNPQPKQPAPAQPSTPAPMTAEKKTTPGAATAPPAAMTPQASGGLFVVEETQDALSFADSFVKNLLGHRFGAARANLDESRVSAQRLAGLCIVFEEGGYDLIENKPLVMTIVGDDASWVIAQVKSEKLAQQTEFGIELQRRDDGQSWRVVGLNLSDLLGSFAQSAAKIGVPYTPIVKNPKGGESLALYFEYDEAGLHPRAQKQLQIVAEMLKSDPSRRLRIAGHADALGAENYNINLSRQRAVSVKKELVALGVAAAQIDTTGLGAAQPLSPNQKSDGTDDPEGRSKNRRAEIYLDF